MAFKQLFLKEPKLFLPEAEEWILVCFLFFFPNKIALFVAGSNAWIGERELLKGTLP